MVLDPALAAVRTAVRVAVAGALADRPKSAEPPLLVVACSGGADSLALAAATVFEATRGGVPARWQVLGAVVDHGLQDGSADHSAAVVGQLAALGVDETATIRVRVDPGPGGIEAGAREARYAALAAFAGHRRADLVLLGHTRDDQAESALLGLTRGSGPRSLQGMRPSFRRDPGGPLFLRPLLEVTRQQTEGACRAESLDWWEDPHNSDPRFTRARVRHTVLPTLEAELGPGVAAALARTATMLREDVTLLDEWADAEWARLAGESEEGIELAAVGRLAPALARRILRRAALQAGASADELTYDQLRAVARLIDQPGLQIQLPGWVTAVVQDGRLVFRRTDPLG